jgi:hypothetical protein
VKTDYADAVRSMETSDLILRLVHTDARADLVDPSGALGDVRDSIETRRADRERASEEYNKRDEECIAFIAAEINLRFPKRGGS